MTTITPEQRLAISEAGDAPIEVSDPQSGDAFVLVRAEVFRRMQDLAEGKEDLLEHEAWAKAARNARYQWSRENAY